MSLEAFGDEGGACPEGYVTEETYQEMADAIVEAAEGVLGEGNARYDSCPSELIAAVAIHYEDEVKRLREIENFLREDLPDSKRWVERAEVLLSSPIPPSNPDDEQRIAASK